VFALGPRPIKPLGDQVQPFEFFQKFSIEKSLGSRLTGRGLGARRFLRLYLANIVIPSSARNSRAVPMEKIPEKSSDMRGRKS
jgi:hypothetical protein